MSRIVGIDLGTTNSVIAVLEGGEPRVISNEEGSRVTPSVVAFAKNDDVLVGDIARRQAVMNPEATIYSVKRFMGQRFNEVGEELKQVTYPIVEGMGGGAAIGIGNRSFSPPEISAKILQKLRRAAEQYLGEPVTEAVITVPAYFNDAQRKATKDAGEIAGLKVRRIINEPTAAALGYGLNNLGKEELIAVFDLGGGTFDISLLELGGDVVEVLSTNGDTHLGGDNIDHMLVQYFLAEFKKDTGIDVSEDKMVLQRLRESAEKAKIELSSVLETDINLPFLTADSTGPKHFNLRISRAKFDHMIGDLVERTLAPCRKALQDANKIAGDIDQVILVGGSTRIPLVQKKVSEFFGREPNRGVNPDEVVALGAAIQGGVLTGEVKDLLLLDVTPLSLGLEAQGGVMARLISRNTTIPTSKTKIFSTVVDNQSTVAIKVFQGERDFVADNRSLGLFELSDLPAAPRATPQIEVRFDIDANGILSVSATEKRTGKAASITIQGSGGLTPEDIERAVLDAADAADRDSERRKTVELRNKLTGLTLNLHRALREDGELLDEAARAVAEAAIVQAEAIERDVEAESEAVQESVEQLAESLRLIAEKKAEKEQAAKAEQAEGQTEGEEGTTEGEETESTEEESPTD